MDSILLLNAKYSREVYWMLKIKKQIGIYVIRGEKVNENTFFKFKWFK